MEFASLTENEIYNIGQQVEEKLGSRWLIERLIARGGHGLVYQAQDNFFGRPTIVKLTIDSKERGNYWSMAFMKEVRLLARLRHANILTLYDGGIINLPDYPPIYYLIAEYIPLHDLTKLLNRYEGMLPVDMVMKLTLELLRGLQYLHAQGILHRDIKPENILIGNDGIRITDFDNALDLHDTSIMELKEHLRGTPGYVAPEQLMNEKGDFRSDLYAVGTIMYELLTRQFPFSGKTSAEIIKQQLTSPVRPITEIRPDVNPVLAEVAMKLLKIKPAERYSTAQEVLQVLNPRK